MIEDLKISENKDEALAASTPKSQVCTSSKLQNCQEILPTVQYLDNSTAEDKPSNVDPQSKVKLMDDLNPLPSTSEDCERSNLSPPSTSGTKQHPIKKYTVSGQETTITQTNDSSKLEAPTVLKRVHKGRPAKAPTKVNDEAFASVECRPFTKLHSERGRNISSN